jgi:hypothetical protein
MALTVARAIRIAACADYIMERPIKQIEHRNGVAGATVVKWMRQVGQFKIRGQGRSARPLVRSKE